MRAKILVHYPELHKYGHQISHMQISHLHAHSLSDCFDNALPLTMKKEHITSDEERATTNEAIKYLLIDAFFGTPLEKLTTQWLRKQNRAY